MATQFAHTTFQDRPVTTEYALGRQRRCRRTGAGVFARRPGLGERCGATSRRSCAQSRRRARPGVLALRLWPAPPHALPAKRGSADFMHRQAHDAAARCSCKRLGCGTAPAPLAVWPQRRRLDRACSTASAASRRHVARRGRWWRRTSFVEEVSHGQHRSHLRAATPVVSCPSVSRATTPTRTPRSGAGATPGCGPTFRHLEHRSRGGPHPMPGAGRCRALTTSTAPWRRSTTLRSACLAPHRPRWSSCPRVAIPPTATSPRC